MKVHLMIIDPEWDFCWPGLGHFLDLNGPEWKAIEPLLRMALGPLLDDIVNPGKLYVPGAWEDMGRLADMILRLKDKIDDIHVTIDAHQIVDQAHPIWWKSAKDGVMPNPFTLLDMVGSVVQSLDPTNNLAPTGDEYTTKLPSLMHKGGPTDKGSRGYLEALAARGRFKHVVWPVHCEIGTLGSIIVPSLMAALQEWQRRFAIVDFVTKGSNIGTEHYGAVEAEVPDPKDDTTQINTELVASVQEADILLWAGEASTHCLPTTFRGVVNNFSDPRYIKKCVLLTDATSPVPGFEQQWDDFLAEMTPKGMQTATTVDVLS